MSGTKVTILLLLAIMIFSFYGCYTSFTHPPIEDTRWGAVQLSDDCAECHDNQRYSTPVLPQAAQEDYHWQFYSGSAWWQDDYTLGGVAVHPDNTTGPRAISNTPMTPAPVSMPVQGAAQSLGKKSAADQSQSKPEKRTIKRRSNTSSSSSDSSEEKAPSRGRRD